jgi:hypothetical protein
MDNKNIGNNNTNNNQGGGEFLLLFVSLGSLGCIAPILFLCWARHNNQQQATKIDSNNQQPKQQSTTKTTTHTTIKQRKGFLFILFLTGKLTDEGRRGE